MDGAGRTPGSGAPPLLTRVTGATAGRSNAGVGISSFYAGSNSSSMRTFNRTLVWFVLKLL